MDKPYNSRRFIPAMPCSTKNEIVNRGRKSAKKTRAANAGAIFFSCKGKIVYYLQPTSAPMTIRSLSVG